jgi:hypothetical protein
MYGKIQRTLKSKSRTDIQSKFHEVIGARMLMYGSGDWALNRSERRNGDRTEREATIKAFPWIYSYRPGMQYAMRYKYVLYKIVSKTSKASGVIIS